MLFRSAIRVGNRILLLSAHPGQVRAELDSTGTDMTDADGMLLSSRIHHLLFGHSPAHGGGSHD